MKDQIRNVIRGHGHLSVDPGAQRLRERRLDRRGARRGRGPGVSGIVGYRNDTPNSIGRHLRDTMSARLMVANERIHATDASLLLVAEEV